MSEHVYTATTEDAPEVTILLDLANDLHQAAQLPGDEDEREAAVKYFTERYMASLAAVAEERGVTVWVTRQPGQEAGDEELRREIWQAAHDRTPAQS